jgi:type VI secretion system protein VasD
MSRLSLVLIYVLMLALLQACGGPAPQPQPEPPKPTIVNLEIRSAADINSDTSGKASPVMLRIYELRETSSFGSADFFSLFNQDQATLSSESVRKQELLLKPGDTKMITIQPEPDTRALGFFAAFRQLDTAQWRALMPITAHQTQSALIIIKGNELLLKSVEAGH